MVTAETKKQLENTWDSVLAKNHPEANFLQSSAWAATNQQVGHEVVFLKTPAPILAIVKSAKRGRYLEIPGGPLLNWQNPAKVSAAFTAIADLAKQKKCAFVRLRPQLLNTKENLEILKDLGLKPSPMHLHAEHTVIINLKNSEETLLSGLRRQTRYEVRRAEKLGLKVTHLSADHPDFKNLLHQFFETQKQTALRQHFVPPSFRELTAEASAFGEDAVIYLAATPENQPIAYGLILKWHEEADYFEAASTELNRKLPGAYALLWQAMRDLKKSGCRRFNLWGIAPPNQPHHRYAKVTTFKTGFGGETVHFVPAHDLVISKFKYLPDYFIETARRRHRHLN